MAKIPSEADAKRYRMAEKRMRDVILFTLGTLQELKDQGVVSSDDGADRLTAAGMSMFFALKAQGFEYEPGEVEYAMTMFARYGHESPSEQTV